MALDRFSNHISNDLMEQFHLAGLPESDVAAVWEHLRNCSHCRCRSESFAFWFALCSGQVPPEPEG